MNDQTLEERLVRSLDQQAGAVFDAPFGLDDVRDRASSIRRRRRGIAVGAAAAVLAVVVPTALLVGGGNDRAVDPAPQPVVGPGSATLHDGVITLADGRTVAVDLPDDVTMFGVLADGRFVVPVNETESVHVLSPDGAPIAEYPVLSTVIRMGEGHRTVAWTAPDYRIQVLESEVAEPVAFPGVPMEGEAEGSIDAVLGSDCAGGGCRVLAGDYTTTSYEITLGGAAPLTTSAPFRVEDVSPDGGLWTVQYADDGDPQFGCSGVYDAAAATITARTCDTSNLRFSPDGRHLTGMRGDNSMYDGVTVLDLDLQSTVLRYEPADGAVVSRAAWADADHLLVSTAGLDGEGWTLSRIGIDGATSDVVDGPAPGGEPELVTEYVFSE